MSYHWRNFWTRSLREFAFNLLVTELISNFVLFLRAIKFMGIFEASDLKGLNVIVINWDTYGVCTCS